MGERIIPGLSIEPLITRHWESISLIPLNMILHDPKDISNTKMLLDYSCGTFYEKANIVRVDKTKMEIHFRNGKIIDMANLKAVKLKNMVGFELANKINNSLTRLKEEGK